MQGYFVRAAQPLQQQVDIVTIVVIFSLFHSAFPTLRFIRELHQIDRLRGVLLRSVHMSACDSRRRRRGFSCLALS